MQKDFWRDLFRGENKKAGSSILFVLFMGVLLLVISRSFYPDESNEMNMAEETQVPKEYSQVQMQESIEKRMAEILSKIEGAGEVDVMITYSQSVQEVPAQNLKTEESQNDDNGKTSLSKKEEISLVMTEDSKGNTAPVMLTQDAAKVEGVVIVAQGGDSALVCNTLNNAAQALLNVPAHKVAITKMK